MSEPAVTIFFACIGIVCGIIMRLLWTIDESAKEIKTLLKTLLFTIQGRPK